MAITDLFRKDEIIHNTTIIIKGSEGKFDEGKSEEDKCFVTKKVYDETEFSRVYF